MNNYSKLMNDFSDGWLDTLLLEDKCLWRWKEEKRSCGRAVAVRIAPNNLWLNAWQNTEKRGFFCFCTRLLVPLHPVNNRQDDFD